MLFHGNSSFYHEPIGLVFAEDRIAEKGRKNMLQLHHREKSFTLEKRKEADSL
ncbi:MAG: hypothetical protein SOR61_06030 [Evtepia sp.]|nr:hypothetical protein [Evtepia sp.]